MENKKTSELIDMLDELKEDDYSEGGKYQKIMGELETREFPLQILGEDWDTSLPMAWKAIEELQEEIKKLKRHKHDDKTGDVMVRV